MAKKESFSSLASLLLLVALVCLIGHHIVDAFGVSCQPLQTAICGEEANNSIANDVSENNWKDHILHTGFEVPQVAISIAFSFFCLYCSLHYIFLAGIKPPVLSPPPQKFV